MDEQKGAEPRIYEMTTARDGASTGSTQINFAPGSN